MQLVWLSSKLQDPHVSFLGAGMVQYGLPVAGQALYCLLSAVLASPCLPPLCMLCASRHKACHAGTHSLKGQSDGQTEVRDLQDTRQSTREF